MLGMKASRHILTHLFYLVFMTHLSAQDIDTPSDIDQIGQWDKLELQVTNGRAYQDPYREVELRIWLKSPEGREIAFWGFYDGDSTWKVRFSPDEIGKWHYSVWFSDAPESVKEGAFHCVASDLPGQVHQDQFNPFWLGYKAGQSELFRSFHVGDRFFARNWDDPFDASDGEQRTKFLNWMQQQGYNMLSIASHYLNRQQEGRGLGWETPKLWPLDCQQYRFMEVVLDTLSVRGIIVFPFAGFFGARGNWPTDHLEQEHYIKYTLARIGHYWNIILNVAGPEPFWRQQQSQYQGAMKWPDINRLGQLIQRLDVHDHLLTVHNEKPASENGDPFLHQQWYDMATIQGPTTLNRPKLYSGLAMNHHLEKPVYAQETLWYGNKNHPSYSDDNLRKHAYTILFSGSTLNFADMNGNSSTGFSGTMDFDQLHPEKHRIVHKVWDWFGSIPFHKLRKRQDLVKGNGYCLAKEGEEYYVYIDSIGEIDLFIDYDYAFKTEWINAANPSETVAGPTIRERTKLKSPQHGDDWILHAFAAKPERIAIGNFPDIAVDNEGNLHIVYNREGLKYQKYQIKTKSWSLEESPGCICTNVKRSDPDIVVDSIGRPIVFCGSQAARWDGSQWINSNPGAQRDTELAIDKNDNVYLCHRGGNNGGYLGLKMLPAGTNQWVSLTDPDQLHFGKNDHVYPDIFVDEHQSIHLVQRHGPEVEVTYRRSDDGGNTWPIEANVSNERSEAPHIIVDHQGEVLVATGKGYVFQGQNHRWDSLGRLVTVQGRSQPEFGLDQQNNVYLTAFGGRYNIRFAGMWMGEGKLDLASNFETIGFVESAGAKDFAYIIWEEGQGDADQGLLESSWIYVGKLYPDGRLIKL